LNFAIVSAIAAAVTVLVRNLTLTAFTSIRIAYHFIVGFVNANLIYLGNSSPA
jgi:hypothetical protein